MPAHNLQRCGHNLPISLSVPILLVYSVQCYVSNGIVGKAYRHEIGFFTTLNLILIFFLKPTLNIPLQMCPNQYILLLNVYISVSVFKACLNTYQEATLNEPFLETKKQKKIKSGCINS